MNNIPTIVPKTIKPVAIKGRLTKNSLVLFDRRLLSPENITERELTQKEKLQLELTKLKSDLANMIHTFEQKDRNENIFNIKINEHKFTLEQFKQNSAHFKLFKEALKAIIYSRLC